MIKNTKKETKKTPDIEEKPFNALEEYNAKISELEEQVTQVQEQILRTLAESENIKRRTAKEVEDAKKFAVSNIAKDLINVVENLYRSTEHVTEESLKNEEVKKIYDGIKITQNEFISILGKYGVERILPNPGDPFDHNHHQAISTLKDDIHPQNTVINVIQAGYILKDRLIRPAMIVVSSGKE